MADQENSGSRRESSWLESVRIDGPDSDANEVCFYKVLPNMRYANSRDYDPVFFTFGPYHARLTVPPSSSDCYKVRIAKKLTNVESFQNLVRNIREKESVIRKIYGEQRADGTLVDDIRGEDLAHLLALDALTVVGGALFQDALEPRNLGPVIWRDAMLLEQQLPFFILQAARESIIHRNTTFDLVSFYASLSYPFHRHDVRWLQPSQDLDKSLLSHIHRQLHEMDHRSLTTRAAPGGLGPSISVQGPINVETISTGAPDPLHRMSRQTNALAAQEQESGPSNIRDKFDVLPTASKLHRYGIAFQVGDGGFTGIYFNKATRVLTLPQITVFDDTKAYLLNLVALEAVISNYKHHPSTVLSSYILLMDFLIDTKEDVKLLVEKDVIRNQVGSDAKLAEMWNTLATNLPICFTKKDSMIIDDLKEATRPKFRMFWASFYDTFCVRKPWHFISVIAAFTILVLTLLQTIFTIRSASATTSTSPPPH